MQQVISTQKINLIHHGFYGSPTSITRGLVNNFITWCNIQDRNRFLWLGIALMGGIGTVLPLTLLAIVLGADNNFCLWITTCIINVPILVVSLAAQPTKVILPVLFFAWLVDAIIIASSIAVFFIK